MLIVNITLKYNSVEKAKELHNNFKELFKIEPKEEERNQNFRTIKELIAMYEKQYNISGKEPPSMRLSVS